MGTEEDFYDDVVLSEDFYDDVVLSYDDQPSAEELWEDWLNGPACEMGAHPTVFHHQHVIVPATWHCYCGKIKHNAKNREDLYETD